MSPTAPRNNLPPDVVRVLSFHGPAEVVVGDGDVTVTSRAAVAPFEDVLHILVPHQSPLHLALLETTVTSVHARAKDGEYSLRLTGRASAGRPLTSHPERGAIEPWVTQGTQLSHLSVVTFAAWACELTRNEAGGEPVRYHGPTRLGQAPPNPAHYWSQAALGGVATPFLFVALAVPFAWLIWQGEAYRFRPLALVLSGAAGISAIAGVRLLTLSLAFHRWRAGRARATDAPVLTAALIAPHQARKVGVALLGVWAVLVGIIAAIWGDLLVVLAGLSHATWLWGPAVTAHLMARQPE